MLNCGDGIVMELIKRIFYNIKNRYAWLGLALVIVFINVFSFQTLTTKPAVWYDEGINIELARNFSEFGKLDIAVAPNTFADRGATIGSTGYPITGPLALVFKLFGFGFAQARIYMLLWMSIFLICVFYFAKKSWGENTALLATALIATFASFYGNGRSVMGEIPGFTFILLSLFWYFYRKSFFITGIFLGLAVVSKPAVYIYFIPAFVIILLFDKKSFFPRTFKLGAGSLLAFIGWIIIYAKVAFSPATWQELGTHFANPYAQEGLTPIINIKNNLASFFHQPTLIYFSLLALVIVFAIYCDREYYKKNRQLFLLCGFYSLGAFFYFLKNITIYHYIAGIQFLIFILVAPSIKVIASRFFRAKYARLAIFTGFSLLLVFQLAYLLTKAKLFYSDSPQQTFAYIQKEYGAATVGLINIPAVASLIPAEKKFQIISTYGVRDVGANPLSLNEDILPGVLIMMPNQQLEEKNLDALKKHYEFDKTIGGDFEIYQKSN